jgi:hypothetical protein
MGISDDNFKVTSSDPTGATVATDFVSGAHYQYVKLAVGADNSATPVDSSNPLNVVYTSASNQTFVPVSGNTSGTSAVPIEICGGASLSISAVEISGGTIDAIVGSITAGINTIAGGITVGVATIGSTNMVEITGDVQLRASTNNIGDVDVLTVAIPSAITHGQVTAPKLADGRGQMNHYVYTSGVRITNISATITALIGGIGVTVGTGYPLAPLDTVFLEGSSGGDIWAVCAGNTGATLAYIGS